MIDMLPNSREAARQAGVARYFTGEPCKQGHTAPRAVASGSCTACTALASKRWAAAQAPERLAKYTAAYRQRQKTGAAPTGIERVSRDGVEQELRVKFGAQITLGQGPVSYTHKVQFVCATHGPFDAWLINVRKNSGCAQCSFEAQRLTQEQFLEKAKLVHGETYDYAKATYVTAVRKVTITCKQHGDFEQTPNKHLGGQGCPRCGAVDPKWERELFDYLYEQGFVIKRNAPVLGRKHIDIFLPEYSFGIELNGLHWHTEQKRGKDYHREKWEAATAQGIRLIQIFADEWRDKKELILRRLDAMLGIGEKFDARKCAIELLAASEARAFLDATHIQGAGAAQMYYGLRLGAQIVAVASFGKARAAGMTSMRQDNAWEVIRYASIGRVRGGFGKLFNQFLKDIAPQEVVSFCDLRYGDGKLYQATGFTLDSITPPDYWWVPNGAVERIPRYVTQKHKLPTHPVLGKFYAPGKTEAQVCAEAGWAKLFGVGHQRWVWRA